MVVGVGVGLRGASLSNPLPQKGVADAVTTKPGGLLMCHRASEGICVPSARGRDEKEGSVLYL